LYTVLHVGLRSIAMAIVYRDVAFFKRWFSEYFVLWTIPMVFSLGVVLLPSTISSIDAVINRFNDIMGVSVDITSLILYAFTVSAIMSLTLVVVDETVNTLYQERHLVGVLQTVLESTNLRTYLLCQALVKPLILALTSTMYLAILLPLIAGTEGLITYAYVLPTFVVSGIALGLYALVIAIPITFYIQMKRPWIIANLLVPSLLAGSGLYIPMRLAPEILRLIAQTTVLPYECELLRIMLLQGLGPNVIRFLAIITALLAFYTSVDTWLTLTADKHSRNVGV